MLRTVADEPSGDTAPQHSQAAGHKIGGVPAHPRLLGRQRVNRLRDEPLDMALSAGGDGNLRLAIRVEQFRCQQIDIGRQVTIQLQVDQSAPNGRILDRSGSS